MSNDERSDSLAAQAASWVPPWERQHQPPDRAYQAAAEEAARREAAGFEDADDDQPTGLASTDDELADEGGPAAAEWPDDEVGGEPVAADRDDAASEPVAADRQGARSEPAAGEPDVAVGDPSAASQPGDGSDAAGLDGDLGVAVDAPAAGDEGSPEPSLGELGPELPLPGAVEEAAEAADDGDFDGQPADAPVPADGDDAGDVFDVAADDDVSDDGVLDLPAGVDEAAEDLSGAGQGLANAAGVAPTNGPAASDGAEVGLAAGPDGAASGGAEVGLAAGPDGAASDGAEVGPAAGPDGAASGGVGVAEATGAVEAGAAVGLEAGRAKAGSAVPEQGRRRRDGGAAVGEPTSRTSASFAEGDGTARGEPDLPALMEEAELAAALEAIMLVVDEPVAEMQLAQILEQPTERVGAVLEDLSARYTAAGHGFDLRRAAGGWRLYTRPEYAAYVERFVLDGQSVRLTQAALETLAVVAYKQPVTRSRISAIRGVNCDGVMRTLVTRGLIEECGTEGETGAYLYRTTALFLEKLGLNSVDQLPPLAPFLPDDVEEVLDAPG